VIDEAYACTAAVAVRSLLQRCSAPHSVRICIVDLGLCEDSRHKLQQCVWDALSSSSSSDSASSSSVSCNSSSEIYWIHECEGMHPR
jgi:hypothetical protein